MYTAFATPHPNRVKPTSLINTLHKLQFHIGILPYMWLYTWAQSVYSSFDLPNCVFTVMCINRLGHVCVLLEGGKGIAYGINIILRVRTYICIYSFQVTITFVGGSITIIEGHKNTLPVVPSISGLNIVFCKHPLLKLVCISSVKLGSFFNYLLYGCLSCKTDICFFSLLWLWDSINWKKTAKLLHTDTLFENCLGCNYMHVVQ